MTGPEDSVLVLYSGGLDSTLVAALCAKKFKRIILVTFDIDYTFFVNNSRKYAKTLSELFPDNIYEHHLVNCNKSRKKIWNGFCQDYFTFCTSGAPGHICLGCKMAMLVDSIEMCLKYNIGHISNGMSRAQSDHPECMPGIVNRFAHFMKEYNILYVNDLYENTVTRDEEKSMLNELGIKDMGVYIGQSNVSHQPRCLLGPYSTLWKTSKPLLEKDMLDYFDSKAGLMRELLKPYDNLKENLRGNDDYFTFVDESRRTTHEYEFSAGIDKTIGFLLTPIWWLSRGFFRIGKMLSKRKNSHQADNGTVADI